MKLRDLFVRLFLRKGENLFLAKDIDPALVCVNQGGKYVFLSEIETLENVSMLMAQGTWGYEDFILLKRKLRINIPSGAVNVVLHEVDMRNVRLDPTCDSIDFRGLFNFCLNLVTVILPDATDFEGSISFRNAFQGCSKLRKIYNLATYRRIFDLRGAFYYCMVLDALELYADPFPRIDSDTFQRINRDIRITLFESNCIPLDWVHLNAENVRVSKSVVS